MTADRISVMLDENDRAQRVIAEGHPVVNAGWSGCKGKLSVSAEQIRSFPWVPEGMGCERIIADGKIAGSAIGRRTRRNTVSLRLTRKISMMPQRESC